jgi:dienelactone hydrolase
MADVIVFHHSQGLTSGVRAFASRLVGAGHRVMVPDLYDGETFETLDDGVAHAEAIGFDTLLEFGASVASTTDAPFATVGFSLGVLPAQYLAQTHSRAVGAVLCHAAVSPGTFADSWPSGVALQIHTASADALGDIDDARALAAAVNGSQLFEYDTAAHLVTDASLADHDPAIAEQVIGRTLEFLAAL